MISKPVNTALCLDNVGTFCNQGGGGTGVTFMADSNTTTVSGNGSEISPFRVEVKVDPSGDNAIEVTAGGLFVDASALGFNVSFSNDVFSS